MRKLIFLGAVLAVCMSPLASCSKDEPTPMDKAKENVAGTEWLAVHHRVSYTMKFKNDGTYNIDASNGESGRGTYTQSGTRITFRKTWSWGGMYDFNEGTITYGGGTMNVPVYYYDGASAGTMSFTLNVLK